jgi:TolB protein
MEIDAYLLWGNRRRSGMNALDNIQRASPDRRTTGSMLSLAAMAAAILAAVVVAMVVSVHSADAAFPGNNGKIAFVREGARDSHIFTINPNGTGLRKISTKPRFDSSPSWSADGKKMAFSGVLQGNWDIYVINANGSGLKRITKSSAGDFSPTWSPDGKKIAFVRQRGEGDPSTVCESCIYKIKVNRTGLTRLTDTKGFASDPAWSPNGKKIAFSKFVRRIGGQIFTMNAADGRQKWNLTNTRLQESEPD